MISASTLELFRGDPTLEVNKNNGSIMIITDHDAFCMMYLIINVVFGFFVFEGSSRDT